MHAILKNKLLLVTYMLIILYALHCAIPVYATSSFLHMYFKSSTVSILYVLASLATLLFSMTIAKSIRKFHTYPFTFFLVIAEIIALITFASTNNPYIVAIFFIIHFILQAFLYICLNVFIESFSKETQTGSIRGLFLALINMGFLISPLIGGVILSHNSFKMLYIVASLVLLPFLYFIHKYLKDVKDPAYHRVDVFGALRAVFNNKNLKIIFITQLVVECFYSVMIIYSPLYLTTLGIPLTSYLTYILPIALIPLVILPYELGFLSQTRFSEKEILVIGLLILTVSTFLCVITESTDLRIWALILFASRVGTSCIETMTFTYYFKKVGPEDASLTALFVSTRFISYIFVGVTIFLVSDFLIKQPQLVFVILGCLILWCLSYVLSMHSSSHHKYL